MSDCRFARSHVPMNNLPVPGAVLHGFFLFFLSSFPQKNKQLKWNRKVVDSMSVDEHPFKQSEMFLFLGEILLMMITFKNGWMTLGSTKIHPTLFVTAGTGLVT